MCRALALAIEADASAPSLTLHVSGPAAGGLPHRRGGGGLAEFARALDMCRDGTALVSWAVECTSGAEIRVRRRPPAAACAPRTRAAA
ncbi:MAG: hypothetical protein ACKOZU_06085 [Planctomycetaceae bacterium]